jgi:hypothetical protein
VQTTKQTIQHALFIAHVGDFVGDTVLSIDRIPNVSPVITRIAFGVESQIDNLGGISRLDLKESTPFLFHSNESKWSFSFLF